MHTPQAEVDIDELASKAGGKHLTNCRSSHAHVKSQLIHRLKAFGSFSCQRLNIATLGHNSAA